MADILTSDVQPSLISEGNKTVSIEQLPQSAEKPRVQKFKQNIYNEVPYSSSVVADYINAFYDGYNFADYSFA